MQEKIPHRLTRCILGDEPFSPGSEYISVLTSTEEGWKRADYCPACWEKEAKNSRAQFWRGKIPLKKEKKLASDEKALEFFRKIEDPKLLSVLALYLLRRDQIVQRGEEKKMQYYEIPESGEVIIVPKISLSLEESQEVGEQLIKMFSQLPLPKGRSL